MATQTPTDDKRWLTADQLRELTAGEPDSGPPPPPLHRTEETTSRGPLAFGVATALLALVALVLVLV